MLGDAQTRCTEIAVSALPSVNVKPALAIHPFVNPSMGNMRQLTSETVANLRIQGLMFSVIRPIRMAQYGTVIGQKILLHSTTAAGVHLKNYKIGIAPKHYQMEP